ncbi:MAG: hypothetical protein JO106_12860 [Mycobacterium sp.]|nr:hypothetical protein [Mycobacterium sp.]
MDAKIIGNVMPVLEVIAVVGIIVSGLGEPGTAPGGISLVGTGWWTPDPTPPPAAAPPAAEPPAAAAPVAAPRAAAPPAAPPPAAEPPVAVPPPPPPPELVLRFDDPLTAAFVSITNNAGNAAVGCVYRSVAEAGQATMINYDRSDNFTVTGSAETRVDVVHGPATGSTFHVTVTCDNGLSTSQDRIY